MSQPVCIYIYYYNGEENPSVIFEFFIINKGIIKTLCRPIGPDKIMRCRFKNLFKNSGT